MDRLGDALSDLSADLDRAEHLIRLIDEFRDFGGSAQPLVGPGSDPVWPEASALWAQSQKRRTDLPILSGSLLLYLVGRFENFARTLLEVAAEDIAGQCGTFSDLPPALKKELISRTAEVVQSPRRFGYDEIETEGFVVTLADGLRATAGFTSINSQCLSSTDANLRPDVLASLMKRVGMDNIWPEVGKQSKAKVHLTLTKDSDVTAEAKNRLNELMEDRNRIAHPTAQTAFPDPNQVLKATAFLRMLSEVLTDLVRVYVVTFASRTSQ